jgi:GDPmannose 4,6-dehydratase
MINLIYGVTGQTGSYLAEQLIGAGQEVIGVVRRTSSTNNERIKHIGGLKLIEGDITDSFSVNSILKEVGPDRIYNMAAQSHVGTSFKQPAYTFQVTAGGCLNILEAIRTIKPDTKMLQASSSEMFGKNYSTRLVDNPNHPLYGKKNVNVFEFFNRTNGRVKEPMTLNEKYQSENTAFAPQSPYAIAKLAAHHLVDNYRDSYGLFAACSICFNHESPRRGPEFVTRKITKWIGEFYNSPDKENFPKLRLGNINVSRDWGHARDYARAMEMILDQEAPDDYVICTEKTYTVNDFLKCAFKCIGIHNYMDYVVIDQQFFRPSDVEYLRGDSSKIRDKIGWVPEISFEELVKEMVEFDING